MSSDFKEFKDKISQCIKDEIIIKEEYLIEQVLLPESTEFDTNEKRVKCGDIFISNNEFTLICVLCEDRFDNIWAFGEHIRSKHRHLCGKQGYTDQREVSVDMDPREIISSPIISKVENEDSFTTCAEPPRSFLSDDSDTDPYSEFFETGNNKVENLLCTICNKEYKNKKSLRQHKDRQHKTKPRPETTKTDSNSDTAVLQLDTYCEICDCHYKTKNFKTHAARHDTIPLALQHDPTYLKCIYCNKKCTSRKEYNEHRTTHDPKQPFPCPHCSKCFRTGAQRKTHVIKHTGERPYKCEKCPSSFAFHTNLKCHMQSHLGIKRFSCETCGKKFLLKKEKEVHVRIHTGEKPFQCEECGRGFVSSSKLTEHRKRHTGTKNSKCDICGSRFYNNSLLKEHSVKHTGARPYHCTKCGASFTRSYSLKTHLKIHSDIKEYICNICGKEFSQATGLYSHKKSHSVKN